jgi:hypothetical protein
MLIKEKPILLLNSIHRTGNTFLSFAFRSALCHNYGSYIDFLNDCKVYHHSHMPLLLKLTKEDCTQFVNFRHPDELIPSLTFFNNNEEITKLIEIYTVAELERQVESVMEEYALWIQNTLKNPDIKVIMFDDIKNNIHSVLDQILSSVGIEYKNHINELTVKNEIQEYNEKRYVTDYTFMKNHHLPRGISETTEYKIFQSIYDKSKNKQELLDLYAEIEKRAI